MRAPQQIETPKIQDISSLLIPIQGALLLVPNVSVAEIVPMGRIEPIEGAPDWLLGNYLWRDLSVPLVSFEVLKGDARPSAGPRSRIVVFNATGVSDDLPFFALMAQDLPRLARVTAEELQERDAIDPKPFEMMLVSWAGELAVIPDVPGLEQAILDAQQS